MRKTTHGNTMNSPTTLIIGYGVVGHNLAKELQNLKPDIYDINLTKYNTKKDIKYDFAFVCVDTPLMNDYNLDLTQVRAAIAASESEIYIIKSTCPLGTVDKLKKETGKRIIFSPEYYGGTQHCNNFEFNFTILGGAKEDCIAAIQLLQECYDGRHQFKITDAKTAELVKFMENSFLATKVSFCNQFYDICKNNSISYEELRELFLLDPRIEPTHTFVYDNKPYWDSHCLNKDVPHIAVTQQAPLLQSIVDFNNSRKVDKNEKN